LVVPCFAVVLPVLDLLPVVLLAEWLEFAVDELCVVILAGGAEDVVWPLGTRSERLPFTYGLSMNMVIVTAAIIASASSPAIVRTR
jgi:hypothetical protein